MRRKAIVVADAPSPHQNFFFDTIAELGEVDLHVFYCRSHIPGREVWAGAHPTRARYQVGPELRVGGLPLDPTLLPALLAEPERVPFMVGYYLPAMLAGCLAMGLLRRPWVFWTDTIPKGKHRGDERGKRAIGHAMRRFCLSRASVCLTTGAAGRQVLIELGVPPERAFEIPFVVNHDWIVAETARHRATRTERRHSLGVADDEKLLLFVGRMLELKGLDLLLDAVADLRRGGGLRCQFALVGDGEWETKLREQCGRLGLDDVVHFLGGLRNAELPPWWAAADGFVLPSYFDAWPVVVVEALIAGLPILGSDHCGSVIDRVVAGETGWIFPAGDRAALTSRLREISELPFARLTAMSSSASSSMQRWAPRAMAARFTEVVERAWHFHRSRG